jgi:hypothetical protein
MLSFCTALANRAKDKTPEHVEYIDYLQRRIIERVARGQSFDCDEYQELRRLARGQS